MGITPQQFEQLQQRLQSGRRTPKPAVESTVLSRPRHTVILGVDPSLRGTGYGVISLPTKHTKHTKGTGAAELVCEGTIKCPASWERSRCLARIAQALRDTIRAFQPTVCVVEGLFYAQNLQTALIMGEARGASLVAAAEAGLEVYEIAPRKVKQAIVGYGAAQKFAVAKMVQRLLSLVKPPAPDAADALALALTYAQENRSPLSQASRKI